MTAWHPESADAPPTFRADALHASLSNLLKSAGHRSTPGRRQIIEALAAAGAPAAIAELDVQLAPSSVYRNLAVLERVGAVARVIDLDHAVRYELGEALTDRARYHLICATCGPVGAFELAADAGSTLGCALARITRLTRFHVDERRLDLLGSCARCP